MPIVYDLKTDIRFLQGKEIGAEEGKIEERQNAQMQFCIKLLKTQVFPITTIAEMVDQNTEYGLMVQTYLKQETLVRKSLKSGMEKEKIAKRTNVSLVFINAIEHIMKTKKENIN